MPSSAVLEHPVFGKLYVCRNARARRFLFRPATDGLKVTMPARSTLEQLMRCIDELAPKLQQLVDKQQDMERKKLITCGFRFVSEHFALTVCEASVRRPTAVLEAGQLVVTCPRDTDYDNAPLQAWFVKVVEEVLRLVAKRVFPERLAVLASSNGFSFNALSVRKTHGRWGSCSSKRNINLSLYLLLLPRHLQDYVMLHELCHTKEMNHGPRFWQLMDKVTDGRAKALRAEMKKYDTDVMSVMHLLTDVSS